MPAPALSIDPEVTDTLPVLIAELDVGQRYVSCNPAYQTWFGLDPRQLLGRHFKDIVGAEVYRVAKPRIEQVLQGESVQFEDTFAYRYGPTRQVNVLYTPQRDASGTVTGYVSLTVDVSAQRVTQQRLLELTGELETKVRERTHLLNQTLEALQATFEGAPDAVVVLDAAGIIINANSSAERLFGVPAHHLVGQSLDTFLPAVDVEDFSEFFEESKRVSPEIRSTKLRESSLRHSSGRLIPIEAGIGVSPRLDQFTAFIRDISNRRRLEADLLHVAADERRRIAQDLHDGLCQEISAVHFALAGLARQLDTNQAQEAAQARKLTQALEQTLDHTRKIAHGLAPIKDDEDDLVSALTRLARTTEELCGFKCRLRTDSGCHDLDRDVSNQVYRIAQEALNNIQRHAKASQVEIDLRATEVEIILRITDDGIGIQPLTGSNGNGLRFMRFRAAAINGSLHLRNRPAGGTEILCHIPAAGTTISNRTSH